ncbi:hypothetical protein D3C80_1860500 [compost metagenome]
MADRVTADRQADEQHDDRRCHDGEKGVGRAVGEGDCTTDRLQRQEGDRADCRMRDTAGRKPARALGGKAKGVIFQCLVGDPAVIFPPDRNDPLPRCHALFLIPWEE